MNIKNNQTADEIILEELSFGDRVVVQTLNNTYEFTITNAAKRQGFLTGGSFGMIPMPVTLCQFAELRTGANLKFYVESRTDNIYLKMTQITQLDVLKKSDLRRTSLLPTAELPAQTPEYVH